MPTPIVRRAPYKDFLQPALQRRFAANAAILLAIAYVESLTLSHWDSFIWSWFPLGRPGLRAVVIFLSVFPVVILRIALLHTGIRTSDSPFDTILRSVFLPFSTIETLLTFAWSAWIFSQAYLWSMPDASHLWWITHYSGDRVRLNERALFYTVNLVLLGIVQGFVHICLDQDRLALGKVRPRRSDDADRPYGEGWLAELGKRAPTIVSRSGMVAIAVGLANYTFLYTFLRRFAWRWTMFVFRVVYPGLPKSNIPPGSAPWNVWMLARSMWAGFLLCLLWAFSDVAFRLQLAVEPLKNNEPLTSESKDPNGSLLNGLKSKKPRISGFAMWELALIARDFPVRRQNIFNDIDRKDGPMWSQIYGICTDTIKTVEQRIDSYGRPPMPPPSSEMAPAQAPRQRVVQPPRSDNVWASAPAPKQSLLGSLSRLSTSPGKTPAEKLVPGMKRRAAQVADHLMTAQQKEAVRPETINGMFGTLSLHILNLPVIGPLFQQRFGRRLAKVVLGTPYGELSTYVNSVLAVSQLAVSSLTEDKYGNVQRDVPSLIRLFTVVIKKLERFRDSFPLHWTDVEKKRECAEVTELLEALKDGLGQLITTFGPYSTDLRLSRADMRLAREAAEVRAEERADRQQPAVEMEQVN
ncbi:nucleoporin protein Ndc1-Nup [Xylariaceae sp. FL0804]|nr:nucleoporin protein Ndc1-Nup [Xylariaceae sp. FL0804]